MALGRCSGCGTKTDTQAQVFQNAKYGVGVRVQNKCGQDPKSNKHRCTVCEATNDIGAKD